jgi:hypothetical protein
VTFALLAPVVPAGAEPAPEEPPSAAAAEVLAEFETAAPSVEVAEVGEVVAGRLLVTLREGLDAAVAQTVLDEAGVRGTVLPGFSVVPVEVDETDLAPAVAALTTAEEVVDVQVDRVLQVEPRAVDELRGQQWWWRNVGQAVGPAHVATTGRRGIDIGALDAWRATRGRTSVVVAIVDTGFDTRHPDLAPNLWQNPRVGAFGCRGDHHGCNFSRGSANGEVFASSTEDRHGTHVAGVVAAAENGVGTVGVAPRVQLMSVKFLMEDKGSPYDGIRAVQYAAAAGADVINASWGFVTTGQASGLVSQLDATIREARIPFVTAAGNGGGDAAREFPASSIAPNVITVTAVDHVGEVPGFANVSTSLVDVAAPGVAILSTLPGNAYGYLDGTSQAAPMVTGAVALAISATGVRDGARIAAAVRAGARPFGTLGHPNRPSGLTRAGLASAPGTMQALGVDLGACRGGAPRAPFRDLDRADVHTRSVDCIVQHGLAGGFPDGRFRPAQTVTRGQVATFLAGLVRTSRDLAVPRHGRFADLAGDVHRDNIEALAAIGIVSGFRDGTYQPSNRVTREQFASLLVRTYEYLAQGSIRVTGGGFADVSGVHERNVLAGNQLGFIQGRTSGRFAPADGVTRAQLASLLRRALDKLVNDRVSRVR